MSQIIIANWKMNLSVKKSLEFVKKLKKSKHTIVISAPYTFLCELSKKQGDKFKLAAQDVAQYEQGAFTGEVSAQMLKMIKCSYCLVGHSERRIYFKETDQQINQKIKQLNQYKIKPVLCIGENQTERQKGLTQKVLKKQLQIDLKGITKAQGLIVAYEPVWAISTFQKKNTKVSASLDDIIEAHTCIRSVLKQIFNSKEAAKIKILYGGTVKPASSAEILSLKQVNGVLVGGASLKIKSFNAILESIK